MPLYTLLNLIISSVPLLLSFERRISFWKKWPQLFLAILVVGSFFIIWDIIVTDLGHWSFSIQYAGDFEIFGLPPGEWLFFITVPYACIFIYECVKYFTKEKVFTFKEYWYWIISLLGLLPLLVWPGKGYTVINGLVFTLTMLLIYFFGKRHFKSSWTIYALVISFIPFVIFNGVFTALPIVSYNPHSIIGLRVLSIPIEDFFYNFSLLSLNYLFYFIFGELLQSNK